MGSLKNLPEHPEEGHSDPALREAPGLSECDVWDVDSDAHTDVKHDNRVVQGPALLSNVLIVDKLSKSLEGSGQAALPQITHVTTEQEQEQNQLKSLNPQMVDLEVDFSSTISSVSGSLQTETVNTCCAITGEEATDSALCTEVTQDSREQNKQEITILVTNHDFNVESEEEDAEIQKSPGHSTVVESIPSESGGQTESDNVSLDGSIVVASLIEISEVERTKADRNIPAEQSTVEEQCSLHHSQPLEDGCGKVTECGDGTNHKNLQPDVKQTADVISQQQVNMTEAVLASSGETGNGDGELKGSEIKDVCEQKQNEEKMKTGQSLRSAESVEHAGKKGPLSDRLTHSPGRQQHVQTQVSLEVMYQSVATSPMTPPEGSAAFLFPNSFGKFGSSISGTIQVETKDVEMQAGLQVESRSVATAPMSPTVLTAPEVLPEPRGEPSPEEPMEPVQEVRWDEKGMTWEVYGAVVEVAVLGTAIQKHLEKQVKKQHKPQPATTSEDTPDPNPADAADAADAANPLPSSPAPTSPAGHGGSTKGSGKKKEKRVKHGRRRQNPLRLLFRNTQQPSCCSRAHAD